MDEVIVSEEKKSRFSRVKIERRVSAEFVILIMFITTWFTYRNEGVLGTIPFIIIVPFVLRLFYRNGWLIVGTNFISAVCFYLVKSDSGLGIFLIGGMVIACSSAIVLAKGIQQTAVKKRFAVLMLGVICVVFSGMLYVETWGNPVGYLNAQSKIEDYINKNYQGRLQIVRIKRSFFSMQGYSAEVVEREDCRDKSTLFCDQRGNVIDRYYDETCGNMMEQTAMVLTSLIDNRTNLSDYDFNAAVKLEVPVAEYRLHDRFLGDTPIGVDVQLLPNFEWKRKDSRDNKIKTYSSKEAFAEDAYQVISVLQEAGYQYSEIKVYYYLEDGNTTYEVTLKDGETLSSLQQVMEKIRKEEHLK